VTLEERAVKIEDFFREADNSADKRAFVIREMEAVRERERQRSLSIVSKWCNAYPESKSSEPNLEALKATDAGKLMVSTISASMGRYVARSIFEEIKDEK
jgi:hypothetical protein